MRTRKKGMQSYVDYLLADIQQAEGNVDETLTPISCEEDLSDHFMEIERLMLEEPLNTFGEICGLTREQFPPVEQLSKKQIKQIIKAFRQLLLSWNLGVDFPKKLPSFRFTVTPG